MTLGLSSTRMGLQGHRYRADNSYNYLSDLAAGVTVFEVLGRFLMSHFISSSCGHCAGLFKGNLSFFHQSSRFHQSDRRRTDEDLFYSMLWANKIYLSDHETKLSWDRQKALPSCHYLGVVSWHDDVIKWKHFPCYWPFLRRIYPSPVDFPHKGQWWGDLMFSLICAQTNGCWLRHHHADLTSL